MKSTDLTSFWLRELEARPVFTATVLALFVRALALVLGFQDYWGDSYHNLIISKLTLDNDWVYSDFKDRHLTWLPAFRYWGSLVMWLTGSAKILTLNIANSVLGVFTVTLGTWLIRENIGKKTALLVGVLLALTPYLIVFSYINMAEGFGAMWLLIWVIGVDRDKASIVLIAALIATLTRYELIFFIGIASIYLVIASRKRAFIFSVLGIVLGLLIWSWWSYVNTGVLLNWLWMRIESTTLSTDFYAKDIKVLHRFVILPLAAILQAFPLLIAFIWLKKFKIVPKKYSLTMLMGSLIFSGILFFGYAQTSVIVYPDPRYLVMILPISTIWFCLIWKRAYFRPFITQRLMVFIIIVSLIQLIIPYYRQYSLQPRMEMGQWLGDHLRHSGAVWSDNAVSIASSNLPITRFISTYAIDTASLSTDTTIEKMVMESKISYLTVYPAPYTMAHNYYPQLLGQSPFEYNGIMFVPVFKYRPHQMQKGSVHEYLRMKFEAGTKPASIWKLYYE